MKTLTLLLVTSVFLLGLQGCSKPVINLPKIHTIKRITPQHMLWENDGSMDVESAQVAYRQLKAYNIMQNYYIQEIKEYNILRETIIKDN